MPAAAELSVLVTADVEQATSKLSSFGAGLGTMIGTGVAAAGAAVAAAVAVGVKAAGDLEQSVANISTIKPEIDTSQVFASLNEMSTRIPQTAAQLGDSLYNVFSSVNVSTEDGIKLVETFAKGAVGAGTSAETFGTAAMGVMNAYGLSVDQASHISDVFFNTIAAGVVTGDELASALGPVTQSAKAAGVSLDELGAMIVGVTKEGGSAAQNINNLNNLLQKVTTKEAQKAMVDLGIKTTDATGAFRPTIEVMRDLKERLSTMTESAKAAALQKIFPDAQARQGALTIMSQIDAVDAALETNKTSVGAASKAYETMSATFNSQSKLLMNGLTAILTTIGAMLLPAITPLVTAFSQWLPGAFQDAMAALASFGPMIASVVQVASDAWGTVQQVFAGDWSPDASIQPFVNALGIVATIVQDTVIPAIMGLMQIDYSPLVAVGAFIISQFQVIVDWFVANWPLILQTVQTVGDAITAFWGVWGESIMTVIQAAWTIISTVISTALNTILSLVTATMQVINGDWAGAWATLSASTQAGLDAILTIMQAAWTAIVSVVTTELGILSSIFLPVWETITAAVQTAMTAIQTVISESWAAITAAVQSALDTLTTAIQGAWDGVLGAVTAACEAIRTAILAIWNLIPADITSDLVLIAAAIATNFAQYLADITTQMAAILAAIQTAWTTIQTTIETILTAIAAIIMTQWAAIVETVTTQCAAVLAAVTTAWNEVSAVTTSIWNAVYQAVQGPLDQVVEAVSSMASSVLARLSALAGEAAAAGAAIGAAIVDSIRSAVTARASALADAAASVVRRAIQAAKSAVGAGGGGGDGDGDGRATGGPVTAGVQYTVGEHGREQFVPWTNGTIIPNHALGSTGMSGSGGGTTIVVNVTVQGNVSTEDDLVEAIRSGLIKTARRNGGSGGLFE